MVASNNKINVGLIGFGLSGQVFHAPLLKALDQYEIIKVVSSRKDQIAELLPHAKPVAEVKSLLQDPEIDLVINTAPNQFHFEYSMNALEAGKHVVVEKPFCNDAEECRKLIDFAKKKNRVLSVFHNRRWDGDFLEIQQMLNTNELGEIVLFESHFDRFRPEVNPEKWREQEGPGSGTLYDLGVHLIDQAFVLFGEPDKVEADVQRQRPGAKAADYFHIVFHYGKMRAILHSDCFSEDAPRFRVLGSKGSHIKHGLDPQEQQLKDGADPQAENMPYLQYYEKLSGAIIEGAPLPVTGEEGLRSIEMLERILEISND